MQEKRGRGIEYCSVILKNSYIGGEGWVQELRC